MNNIPCPIFIQNSDPKRPLFFLHGEQVTYAIGVGTTGHLCSLHWGGRIAATDALSSLLEMKAPVFSLATIERARLECPTANTGRFGEAALEVRHLDGSRALDLRYVSHWIFPGKPALSGLPATYAHKEDQAHTLEITMADALLEPGLQVALCYSIFPQYDAITRSLVIRNLGVQPAVIERALSAAFTFPAREFEWLHLSGAWARERSVARERVGPGLRAVGSVRGASGHHANPFLAIGDPGFDETRGEVFGCSLVYSGNHLMAVDTDRFGASTMLAGIHPQGFAWHLEPGEFFQTPEAVLVYSGEGLGGLSHRYHRLYREHLVRGPWRDQRRPVTVNNWEATYFDFQADDIVALARAAAPLGIELLVLDDGWFGRRDDDRSSLGDWTVDRRKLPDGLDALAATLKVEGLAFGLWFEPEMVSPDSELYRAHPDWCLHIPGRSRTEGRNQLVLDFSRDEVVDAIYAQMAAIIESASVTYLKWDMNRYLSEVGSATWPPEHQGEIFHRHILGVYRLAELLLGKFPNLLIEGCSGGGGRFDPGILFYCPQVWTSDNTDAISRLKIQHGTSIVYPPCTMVAHVSAVPNHQTHRSTSLETRIAVALAGVFGFQMDVAKFTEQERLLAAAAVERSKQLWPLLRHGDLHRLTDPNASSLCAWMLVSRDKRLAYVTAVLAQVEANSFLPRLRLRGLEPAMHYRCTGTEDFSARGDFLQEIGIELSMLDRDASSAFWTLEALPESAKVDP